MKYYVVDAFAENIFTGNPAGICVLDDYLNDDIMQKIASENNLPETAFIIKENESYRIRWFTPKYEIDLCGHATLASAFIIHNFIEKGIDEIKFQSMSGELKVSCKDDIYTLDFPTRVPKKIENIEELKDIIGTNILETYISRDLLLVIDNEKTLLELSPNFEKMAQLEIGDGIIVTAKGDKYDFVSCCFYPKCGVNEDPVTGSAHCNLIPYWAKRLNKNEMMAKQISSRGGNLYCKLKGERVNISGKAVLYSEGIIYL